VHVVSIDGIAVDASRLNERINWRLVTDDTLNPGSEKCSVLSSSIFKISKFETNNADEITTGDLLEIREGDWIVEMVFVGSALLFLFHDRNKSI
jgi:hypothetical protein